MAPLAGSSSFPTALEHGLLGIWSISSFMTKEGLGLGSQHFFPDRLGDIALGRCLLRSLINHPWRQGGASRDFGRRALVDTGCVLSRCQVQLGPAGISPGGTAPGSNTHSGGPCQVI